MLQKLDHFTPLSRAVASIDRDSYAARFAVYEREHKALLRRLANADEPLSDDDIVREEQAFRDAIRRIEFADEDHEPTLVPQDEPVEAPAPAPRRPPVWPQVRPPRREAPDVSVSPGFDDVEPVGAVEPLVEFSKQRSVARRVGERMALAAIALALAGVGLWMVGGRQNEASNPSSSPGANESTGPAASENAADAKAQQPSWYSPEMFYVPPPMPSQSAAPPAGAPLADVPLPRPRQPMGEP
jgi:hypothetical protein